jgi:hypothetical protein
MKPRQPEVKVPTPTADGWEMRDDNDNLALLLPSYLLSDKRAVFCH